MYKKKRFAGSRRNYAPVRRRNVKPNYMPVVLILCISIGCGYATAKYVVDPVVNYIPEATGKSNSEITIQTEKETAISQQVKTEADKNATEPTDKLIENSVEVKETGDVAGYALQFGCYSGKAAAEAAEKNLGISGTTVLEQDNMYKIVGEIYDDKEKAKDALENLSDDSEAFVTTIYK